MLDVEDEWWNHCDPRMKPSHVAPLEQHTKPTALLVFGTDLLTSQSVLPKMELLLPS